MTSAPCSAFEKLLISEAKGFFYLKFALSNYTTEQKLDAILKKAHALYDGAVQAQGISSFMPDFIFREMPGDRIHVVIRRLETSSEDELIIGEVEMVPVLDPVSKTMVLALSTDLPVPSKKIKRLTLEQLKEELHLYYELLGSPQVAMLYSHLQMLGELTQHDPRSSYTFDLSSDEKMVGISCSRNRRRHTVFCFMVEK